MVFVPQGAAVPRQVPLLYQLQPLAERQVVLAVLLAQVVGVPEQVPVPLSQVQPLDERQVVLVVAAVHGVGVPVQDPRLDHVQPLAVRQAVLVVAVVHVAGVPVHRRFTESHAQPGWARQVVEL